MLAQFMTPIALLMGAFPMPAGPEITPVETAESLAEIIAINRDRENRMTVPVSIDGKGPYLFMIDTGSQRTAISRVIAGQLSLEFAEQAMLVGVAGSKLVDTVFVPDLTLGRQNYGEVVAPLLEAFDIGADGILGLDGLQDQRILFDFRSNTIAIENVGTRNGQRGFDIVVTARRRSGQLILTDATLHGIKVNVVIDTGAQANIGNRALQNRLRSKRAKGTDQEPTTLASVTGQTILADSGIVPDFQIDRAHFEFIGIAFADSPAFAALGLEDRPTMLLGMDTLKKFARVAIDFKSRRILFDVPNS
jgi:predicted aspartyl protease